MKITFIGAGSTIFARNVLGDCMCTPSLRTAEMALYDIDPIRLNESEIILSGINRNVNAGKAKITSFLGPENRREALRGASFVVNAIQIGGYDPATIIDFEIPKRFGLRQTIADTAGIGGIMRGLRTIPVLRGIADDMAAVCPDALLLNYSNPMAILTGYLQRHTPARTIGLCHSVQHCSNGLLEELGMGDKIDGRKELIAGINHMAWLLKIADKDGNDLYPEIRRRAAEKNAAGKHRDMVRFEYIRRLGYYCTESSEHNAEYNAFFIKSSYSELIDRYNIPLDEYPRRCVEQIAEWERQKTEILNDGNVTHKRTSEYASYIMEAVTEDKTLQIGGNVINTGSIDNLPADACVEVPCLVNGAGILPCHVGPLPTQLAAMNINNVNSQLLTIEAAMCGKREAVYQAAMMDPHTAAELSIDDIVLMCDALLDAHKEVGFLDF